MIKKPPLILNFGWVERGDEQFLWHGVSCIVLMGRRGEERLSVSNIEGGMVYQDDDDGVH